MACISAWKILGYFPYFRNLYIGSYISIPVSSVILEPFVYYLMAFLLCFETLFWSYSLLLLNYEVNFYKAKFFWHIILGYVQNLITLVNFRSMINFSSLKILGVVLFDVVPECGKKEDRSIGFYSCCWTGSHGRQLYICMLFCIQG